MKTPSSPRPSATVILLRDRPAGLEMFMVLRHPKTNFAPGALVFPGGGLEKNDSSEILRKYSDGADSLNDDELCLYIAAIRETFEECGILLARPMGKKDIISADRLETLQKYRDLINNKKITLSEFLKTENLSLACDKLIPFARWITPENLPVRFETLFFLSEAPADHFGRHDGSESIDSFWITPEMAINSSDAGKYFIMFPTRMNILKLGETDNVKKAIANAKTSTFVTVTPVIENRKNGTFLCIPENAGYLLTEFPYGKRVKPVNIK